MATSLASTSLPLKSLIVRPVERAEETRYQQQMAQHHYLGPLPKIGETIWYVATWRDQWLAQIGFSAAALKCGVRDRWIGWDFRTQYDRLRLIANNSRFLILPEGRHPNLGSRVLALAAQRIGQDWQARFGHPLYLIVTFVSEVRRLYRFDDAQNYDALSYGLRLSTHVKQFFWFGKGVGEQISREPTGLVP